MKADPVEFEEWYRRRYGSGATEHGAEFAERYATEWAIWSEAFARGYFARASQAQPEQEAIRAWELPDGTVISYKDSSDEIRHRAKPLVYAQPGPPAGWERDAKLRELIERAAEYCDGIGQFHGPTLAIRLRAAIAAAPSPTGEKG